MAHDFLSELRFRGLLHQVTSEDGLRAHLLSGRRAAYAGFDPTADSLTIGNFIGIKLLMHLQRAGHAPVAVIGGGTGLIGDPSGKSAERQLLTEEVVQQNLTGQRRIFERLLDFSGPFAARLLDNQAWLGRLGYIEVLREVGKHFSVNTMIQRDAVKERLHNREQGISYTEFSYILLQAYDFYHLHRHEGVTLQMGGSDQWGNIASGCDLIRRMAGGPEGRTEGSEAFGLTAPLVLKSDGGKFGKSESGAIWLTADRTSPYALYQFFLNTEDRDIPRFLRLFTFFSEEEIRDLEASHEREPGARAAHRALARHMTDLLHGAEERHQAEAAAEALFSGDVAGLSQRTLAEVFASVPSSDCSKADLDGGLPIVEALSRTALVKSKREAREHLQAGSVTMNGRRVDPATVVTVADLLHGDTIAFRRGKKAWHITRWK